MFTCSHVHVYIHARAHVFVYEISGPVRYVVGLRFRVHAGTRGLGPWAKTPKPRDPDPEPHDPETPTPTPTP